LSHWDKQEVEAARAEWRKKVVKPTLEMERWFEMPRKWTFQMPKLRQWVESRVQGDALNMFGGVTQLVHPERDKGYIIQHNEINEDLAADSRRDAYQLDQWQEMKGLFDTVIFDPPYSAHQAVKTYGVKKAQLVSHARDVVEYVLKPGGRVLSLGFNSTGMSESRGFVKEALALVNCGGSHNDYIILCERHVP
jgi:hypothetical protein